VQYSSIKQSWYFTVPMQELRRPFLGGEGGGDDGEISMSMLWWISTMCATFASDFIPTSPPPRFFILRMCNVSMKHKCAIEILNSFVTFSFYMFYNNQIVYGEITCFHCLFRTMHCWNKCYLFHGFCVCMPTHDHF